MEAAQTQALYGFETREPDLRRSDRAGTYDIKQLWQRSHEIIGLALRGFKYIEIAEILNISPATVSNTLNSALGKQKLSEMREKRDEDIVDVSKKISELTEKALSVYEDVLDSEGYDTQTKLKVADTVMLELSGHRAAQKIDTRHLNLYATAEDLERFKRRGIEAAKDAGLLVEVINDPVD